MPRVVVVPYTPALAEDFNQVSDQSVMTFPTAAARSSAIPTPVEGMHTYRADSDILEFWNGTAWVPVTYSDVTRAYFLLALNTNFGMPADGASRVPFDTKTTDAAGITTTGPSAGWTAPRNGRMHISWTTNMVITSGGPAKANCFSQLSWAGGSRRGGHLLATLGSGDTFASTGSYSLPVTTGTTYWVEAFMSAPGLGKQVFGQQVTWVEGFYL